jgi:Swiss Army Knife RNA repair-like protein
VSEDNSHNPILFVDVDGVISLFGFAPTEAELPGRFHWIDGVAHCIPDAVGERLVRLADRFELVWATGWEEKANEYLPYILSLPQSEFPCLLFQGQAVFGSAHWKLDAIEQYAGDRPAAWIDDNLDDSCYLWATSRDAPTLLVQTRSATGMTDEHVERLLGWADEVSSESAERPAAPDYRRAERIREYVDAHGATRVRVYHLLDTWKLRSLTRWACHMIMRELTAAGVRVEPPLNASREESDAVTLSLGKEDGIELPPSSTASESSQPG